MTADYTFDTRLPYNPPPFPTFLAAILFLGFAAFTATAFIAAALDTGITWVFRLVSL